MKVVGCETAYSIVPFAEFDDTADGQVPVDLASTSSLMDEEPKNGWSHISLFFHILANIIHDQTFIYNI